MSIKLKDLPEKLPDNNQSHDLSASDPETERLRRDIYRSDKEKFHLFAQMLRRNAMLKNANITHNKDQ